MKSAGVCPICKIELSLNKENVKFCKKCLREFLPIAEEQKSKLQLEYEDLEPVSLESGSSPVLLCSEDDLRFFPAEYKKKKQSYLQKYFENATITTREYIPT